MCTSVCACVLVCISVAPQVKEEIARFVTAEQIDKHVQMALGLEDTSELIKMDRTFTISVCSFVGFIFAVATHRKVMQRLRLIVRLPDGTPFACWACAEKYMPPTALAISRMLHALLTHHLPHATCPCAAD